MTTTFSYTILQLVCEQKIDGKPDAISGAHLRLTATKDSNSVSSVVFVPISVDHNSETFTNFNELDEATVRSWIDQQSQLMSNYRFQTELQLLDTFEPATLLKIPAWQQPEAPTEPVESYIISRRFAYPVLAEQLDMLWHAMDSNEIPRATDFYNTIKAVKDQYPKS